MAPQKLSSSAAPHLHSEGKVIVSTYTVPQFLSADDCHFDTSPSIVFLLFSLMKSYCTADLIFSCSLLSVAPVISFVLDNSSFATYQQLTLKYQTGLG